MMNNHQLYDEWKKDKMHSEVSDSFTDSVLKKIYQYEEDRSKRFFNLKNLVEYFSLHPLAQAALVISALFAGLVRITFVLYTFLSC